MGKVIIDGIRYELNEKEKTASIIDMEDDINVYKGAIVIPSQVEYYGKTFSVVSINNYAFEDSNLLTNITIPDSITSIGDEAFGYCTSLISIIIPDSVTNIGWHAFSGCTSLISVTIPNGVSIGEGAFEHTLMYDNLSYWENGALYIDNCLIAVNKNLSGHYAIKKGTRIIASGTFRKCESLNSITIPDGVEFIDKNTFASCSSLSSVSIPNSVTTIRSTAFLGTGVYKNPSYLDNGVLYINDCLIAVDKKMVGSYTIKKGTRIIAEHAFCRCSALNSVVIPNTVAEIGDFAFLGCDSLTSITIPEGVITIGKKVFSNCKNLSSVFIPNSVINFSDDFLDGCESLTKLTIPKSMLLPRNLLAGRRLKTSIIIHEGMTEIVNGAFNNCSSLTSIAIPNGVTSIGDGAFRYCSGLTHLTIPEGVTSIGNEAFYHCSSLIAITIPEGVTSIGDKAFAGCKSLTSITIPNSVTSIGNAAFYDCSSFTSLHIPSNVKEIGAGAFCGCSSLASITISEGVNRIEKNLFKDCSSLCTINIPEGVTSLGDWAFMGCSLLASISVPHTVKTIGYKTFEGCSSLSSIDLPSSMTNIGGMAFNECKSLTAITIPNSIASIKWYTFHGCSLLTSVTIQEGVTSIEKEAFKDCTSLTSITIPEGVTSIGDFAFVGCSRLISITIPKSLTEIGNGLFSKCIYLEEIRIPHRQKVRFLQLGLQEYEHLLVEQVNEEITILLNLAKAHQQGIGVAKSVVQAVLYYSQAAEKGSAEAAYQLAEWYASGEYLMKDTTTALLYYQQAAKTLYKDAQAKAQLLQREIEAEQQCYNDQMAAFMSDMQNQNYQSITNHQTPMRTIVFFDTECNGLPRNYRASISDIYNWPRLIQLAWIVTDENGNVLKRQSHIIYPQGFNIIEPIAKLTRITTERAQREGVDLYSVLTEFMEDVNDAKLLIAHNIDFDKKVVGCELYRENIDYDSLLNKSMVCTMQKSTNFCAIPSNSNHPGYKWPQLEELHMKLFGTTFSGAHDALADVEATKKCFFELKNRGIIS